MDQYNALNAAIAEGVMKVKYGDKEVEYRSIDDMLRLQGLMEACLFPRQNAHNGRRFASFSKGTRPGCGGRRRYYD